MATGVARHGQPINTGEPEIGHHQIRPPTIDQRDRVRPGVGPKGLVADALEKPLAVRDEVRLVVDDQMVRVTRCPRRTSRSNRGARILRRREDVPNSSSRSVPPRDERSVFYDVFT